MELTEAIGSSAALNVFLDFTTDIDGNLLSDKKIRHLLISVHYANSDDGLPNGPAILLNGSGAASGGISLAKDQYTTVKIDVLNSTHVLCWTSGTTPSFSQSNVVMGGAFAVGRNYLNNKDTIDRVRLQTNYPNGTILPAGSSIMITGW